MLAFGNETFSVRTGLAGRDVTLTGTRYLLLRLGNFDSFYPTILDGPTISPRTFPRKTKVS